MKNTTKIMTVAAVMVFGTAVFAGPAHRHHHKCDGLELAAGIVNLVCRVLDPAPTVAVITPPPPPPPVVIRTEKKVIHYPAKKHHNIRPAVHHPAPPPPRKHR